MTNRDEDYQQRNIIIDKAKQKAKEKALKKGAKAVRKVAKVAIKVAMKAIAVAMKTIITLLSSVSLPFLIGAVLVLFAIFIIFIATTLIFSEDSTLTGEAKELQEYIIKQANSTVDMRKPEQIPYKVPEELIISVMQIYESEDRKVSSKKAVEHIAEALTPVFTYEDYTGYTETETTTCNDDGCSTSTSKSEFPITLLTHVTAWNGEMTAEVEETISDWTTSSSSSTYTTTNADGVEETHTETITTKSRTHSYIANENFVEDYTYFESTLMDSPFNYREDDLTIVEILYQAAGGVMNYTAMKEGISLGDFGIGMNVIPGAGVPAEYMQYYLGAQKKYGVDWFVLAAVHFTETGYSTHPTMVSSVGAEGHAQFMRCTWYGWSYPGCKGSNGHVEMPTKDLFNIAVIKKYGGLGIDADGNGKASPWEIADAIYTMAYLLARNGYSSDVEGAIWHYNHSPAYVNGVMAKAKEIKEAASYEASGGEIPPSTVKNGFVQPTTGTITSVWGNRYLNGEPDFHAALDISNKRGTPIVAIADGTVLKMGSGCPQEGKPGSKCNDGWGNYLWLKHTVDGKTYEAVYAHLSKHIVSTIGAKVKQGQTIALMGNSGSSTGPHLHIEMHTPVRIKYKNVINPLLYLPFEAKK
ncbi:peptidoglycan DD-metalloendopeptidase family protein (plasmid) [Ureibacillus chungkukjangi]|uniref:peptidoglycan DD-metalloendopeptidase family protein n=1 Tax=Ureibacillus chungkukjangi TaxID=1202712 RepID=UPI000D381C64|nr:peptidoglycan DD-metalloendopeptidase family protein [Ureibacillus chungkukjangi]